MDIKPVSMQTVSPTQNTSSSHVEAFALRFEFAIDTRRSTLPYISDKMTRRTWYACLCGCPRWFVRAKYIVVDWYGRTGVEWLWMWLGMAMKVDRSMRQTVGIASRSMSVFCHRSLCCWNGQHVSRGKVKETGKGKGMRSQIGESEGPPEWEVDYPG